MIHLAKGTWLLGLVLLSARALAQQPAPLAPEEDDLELPAAPAPATPAPAPGAPAPAPGAPAPAPGAPAPAPAPAPAVKIAAEPPPPAVRSAAQADPTPAPSPTSPLESRPTASLFAGLRSSGYLQGEYLWNALSEDELQPGGAPLNQNRFQVRRGRVRFDRDWDYAAAALEIDANTVGGPAIGIRRAEAALVYRGETPDNHPPLVVLTLGVTDIPFGYDLLESARSRPFMERSLASGALFPTEADAGVKLSGAIAFFRYAVALMNGEPLDDRGFPRDPNNAKDVIGRLGVEVAPAPRVSLWGGSSFAWGKGFHPGREARKRTIAWRDTDESGTLQPGGAELQGIPATAASPSKNFERWVLGLDLGLSFPTPLGLSKLYGEAFLASNYDRGLAAADPIDSPTGNIRHAGGYAALTQEITPHALAGFRGAFYDPNSDVLDSSRGELVPHSQTIWTLSPLVGLVLPGRAKLLFEYDFVRDQLARDESGQPTDADNDQFTARLQVEL
jgi:hypothetical protein